MVHSVSTNQCYLEKNGFFQKVVFNGVNLKKMPEISKKLWFVFKARVKNYHKYADIFILGSIKINLDVIFKKWRNNLLVPKNEPDHETLILLTCAVFIIGSLN